MSRYVVTTAIPYVNGAPHVGHGDHALKNVRAAEAEGIDVTEYVGRTAERFARLGTALELSFDDFIPDQLRPPAPARGAAALDGLRRARRSLP